MAGGVLRKLFGRAPEQRAIDVPWDVGPPAYSASTIDVTAALGLAPVYAAVRLLADSVASLPLHVYRKTEDGTRVRVEAPSLFDNPSPSGTLYDWVHAAMTSLALEGNVYGYMTGIDGYGYPTAIEWLPTQLVSVYEEPGLPYTKAKFYFMGREIDRSLLVHIRAFTRPGFVEGLSPIAQFALLIGSGLETLRYGKDWFGSGGFPPGTFKNSQRTVNPADSELVKARLVRSMRRREPLVYGSDWDYSAIVVPPEEAQFIQSMRLNATQIAAIFGIPPERIGGERGNSMTYSTQEQEEISFLNTTLRPWLVRLEHAFFNLLPERRYVRFNVDSMLRTDLKTRHEVFAIDRRIGLRNIDELRDIEDLPPLPNGEGEKYTASVPAAAPAAEENPPAAPTPLRPRPPKKAG